MQTMKPERIQVAPWINDWSQAVPFIYKQFICKSLVDASHSANHVHRVAHPFTDSEVQTSISGDNVVTVKIIPKQTEMVTDGQYALGQRIDQALSYLKEQADEADQDEVERDVDPDILN